MPEYLKDLSIIELQARRLALEEKEQRARYALDAILREVRAVEAELTWRAHAEGERQREKTT